MMHISHEEYRRKINEIIKQIEDESGFIVMKQAWEQRQGATAEERLQDWIRIDQRKAEGGK
jgi:hypothetical protein